MLCSKLYKPIINVFSYRANIFRSQFPKYLFASAKPYYKESDIPFLENVGNQIRFDVATATRATRNGHPTSAASVADIIAVLFFH